jgi:hypothetical protein
MSGVAEDAGIIDNRRRRCNGSRAASVKIVLCIQQRPGIADTDLRQEQDRCKNQDLFHLTIPPCYKRPDQLQSCPAISLMSELASISYQTLRSIRHNPVKKGRILHLIFVSLFFWRHRLFNETIVSSSIDEPVDIHSLAEVVGNVDLILFVDRYSRWIEKESRI